MCKKWVGLWLLASAAVWAESVAWQSIPVSEVQVSFPDMPRYKLCSESSPVGPITSQNYSYSGDKLSLVANSSKLPSLVLTFRSPEALYEDAASALLKEHKGAQKLSMKSIQVMSQPAAELHFRTTEGEEGRARFVLVKDVLYTTQATWKGAAPPAVDRFLASMKPK